jgi:Threonine dehydrogenase and related Zn-dependent dehydrogenases
MIPIIAITASFEIALFALTIIKNIFKIKCLIMKALLFVEPKKLIFKEMDIPNINEGWALVKTKYVGICGTDKSIYLGKYQLKKLPLILGHEVIGIIEKPEYLKGKVVIPEINFACKLCEYCKSSLYIHCPNRKTLGIDFNGGLSEYFIAPIEYLHIFSGEISLGIFVEPLAAILNIFSQYNIKNNYKVLVIGTGNIAYLLIQVLKYYGITDVDVLAKRESEKLRKFSKFSNVIFNFKESYYDVVFEVSGNLENVNLAIKAAKPRGTIHVKSTPGNLAEINLTELVIKEQKILGTRCGNYENFEEAIKMINQGNIKPELNKIYSFEESIKAFEDSLSNDYLKVAIKF